MTATVGRIVRFVSLDGSDRAAIVTEVEPNHPLRAVGLAVLSPHALEFHRSVPHSQDRPLPGSWHWPSRE
jgi:hypothetical protein